MMRLATILPTFSKKKAVLFQVNNMAELLKQTDETRGIYRLLRCRKTRHYFRDDGWTSEVEKALIFDDEIEAVRACIDNGLIDVELVLRTPGSGTDLFCTPIR